MLEPEEAIQRLANDIRRLKIDFDRFFNGAVKIPPEQLRKRIRDQLQDLRSIHIRSVGLRFRLNNLEARFNTFSVLFPLGHAYWGIIDNLSGQNLINYSLQASVKPTNKLTLVGAFHWFELENNNDVMYNVAGAPVGMPNTGSDIGEEFDMIATYKFNPNFDVQLGYSWFWYGTYVDNNVPSDDATQFYLQSTLRY